MQAKTEVVISALNDGCSLSWTVGTEGPFNRIVYTVCECQDGDMDLDRGTLCGTVERVFCTRIEELSEITAVP